MKNLVDTLVERDGITKEEAEKQVADVRESLMERLADGEMPDDICEEEFGLEPDYLMDLIG
jgi:polyhydroxyalkanoate synthesis regulator phasin